MSSGSQSRLRQCGTIQNRSAMSEGTTIEDPASLPAGGMLLGSARLTRLLRFAVIAGAGWMFDCTIYLGLILIAEFRPFMANLVSSGTAAALVFLTARETVFLKARHWSLPRVSAYVTYSLLVIVLVSVVIDAGIPMLREAAPSYQLGLATSALLLKIGVTPPQFLLNFIVARKLSEGQLSDRMGVP